MIVQHGKRHLQVVKADSLRLEDDGQSHPTTVKNGRDGPVNGANSSLNRYPTLNSLSVTVESSTAPGPQTPLAMQADALKFGLCLPYPIDSHGRTGPKVRCLE